MLESSGPIWPQCNQSPECLQSQRGKDGHLVGGKERMVTSPCPEPLVPGIFDFRIFVFLLWSAFVVAVEGAPFAYLRTIPFLPAFGAPEEELVVFPYMSLTTVTVGSILAPSLPRSKVVHLYCGSTPTKQDFRTSCRRSP